MSISRSAFLAAIVAASLVTTAASGEDLAAKVANTLRDSGAMKGYRVKVKAKSGTVWLEGTVSESRQIEAAVAAAEGVAGVERVVNRLSIEKTSPASDAPALSLALPGSIRALVGLPTPAVPAMEQEAASATDPVAREAIQLTQAVAEAPSVPASARSAARSSPAARGTPRPLGAQAARPLPRTGPAGRHQMAMRTSAMRQPMQLPGPGDYSDAVIGEGAGVDGGYPADGQMVPGSMRITEGPSGGAYCPPGQAGLGAPMPMGGAGGPGGAGGAGGPGGAGVVPVRGGGPNMPNYAWPSYSAYPNYAALQYPTQYSPTAWPYIGPFYPYPQVPLGWRRVSLEWDDGWWWLDFDERHTHSHHR